MGIKDKIRAMFFGSYIGDALGAPVEGMSAEQIAKEYGRITKFLVPDKRKWYKGQAAGTTTDDWQLTKSLAESLIKDGLNMDSQAAALVESMKQSTDGWGGSTKESALRLANGAHWSNSGQVGGAGNGVAMRIAPLAAYGLLTDDDGTIDFAMKLSPMTHKLSIVASSALAQMFAVQHCLSTEEFDPEAFVEDVLAGSALGELVEIDPGIPGATLSKPLDDITERLKNLYDYEEYSLERIIKEFKGGCYCYESIPFTLMFFLKNPKSIESLYDVANSGGDTDTNSSMLGALLGSLNGMGVFPEDLIKQIPAKSHEEILDLSTRFFDKFS